MIKAIHRLTIAVLLLITVVIIAGCGGDTGGGSNPVVILTPAAGEVPAGTSVPVTIKITANYPTLSGFEFQVESDNSSIIPAVGSTKSNNGTSYADVYVKNISTQTQTVHIRAKLKDGEIYSSWIPLTVKPATLTLTPPADSTVEFTADTETNLCAGGGFATRLVVSGANVSFKNTEGTAVQDQSIVISVDSISNPSGLDQVVFFPGGTLETSIPPYATTLSATTNTSGLYLWPVAIDGLIPADKGGQHVFVVNWRVTATNIGDSNIQLNYIDTKQTSVTVQCN